MSSMNIFSLWAIWPNRREKQLHLTLPQFCRGSPSDAPQNDTIIYFLSTVGSLCYYLIILLQIKSKKRLLLRFGLFTFPFLAHIADWRPAANRLFHGLVVKI